MQQPRCRARDRRGLVDAKVENVENKRPEGQEAVVLGVLERMPKDVDKLGQHHETLEHVPGAAHLDGVTAASGVLGGGAARRGGIRPTGCQVVALWTLLVVLSK